MAEDVPGNPPAPDLPKYLREPLEKRSPERLEAVATYASELAEWKREQREAELQRLRAEEAVDEEELEEHLFDRLGIRLGLALAVGRLLGRSRRTGRNRVGCRLDGQIGGVLRDAPGEVDLCQGVLRNTHPSIDVSDVFLPPRGRSRGGPSVIPCSPCGRSPVIGALVALYGPIVTFTLTTVNSCLDLR